MTVPARPPSPLRTPMFRAFWIAGLLSSFGSWVHLVAAAWLMTTLTTSAAPVALLITATSIPTFLLSLHAGALADVVDRRVLIAVTQFAQSVLAAILGLLTIAGAMRPPALLVLTFLLATAGVLATPVTQAVTAELVPPEQLGAAVALGSTSFTLAQALGPAIGGLIVATAGPGPAFLVNAGSFLAVVVVALRWRRVPPLATMPPEHVLGAVRAGLRYVGHTPALRVVLIRAIAYGLCFAALPALLAVISRGRLGASAGQYGLLLGALGVGGLIGTMLLRKLRARVDHEHLVMAAMAVYAASFALLGALTSVGPAFAVLAVAGLAGMTTMSTLNIAAQSVLPGWIRGRGLAVFQLAFAVAMSAGSAGWGVVASAFSPATALLLAAIGLLLNIGLAHWVRLSVAEGIDTAPLHRDEPTLDGRLDPDDGPVLITIDYRVAEPELPAFTEAMRGVRSIRRRDGAMRWTLYGSLEDGDLHREAFLVSSWAEYERLVARTTVTEGEALAKVEGLHAGPGRPDVRSYLGHQLRRSRPEGSGALAGNGNQPRQDVHHQEDQR
jgi:predicted MFS family arabinose efflux permease